MKSYSAPRINQPRPTPKMNPIELYESENGFGKDDLLLLASVKYWALSFEAKQSESYSRLRRHFMSDDAKAQMQQAHSQAKMRWTDQWYKMTSMLLEIDSTPIPKELLQQKLIHGNLNKSKKIAICVELATFTPYSQIDKEESEWRELAYDEQDRKCYLGFCSDLMNEERSTLEIAFKEFNLCIDKIVKSVSGPDYTWVWVGLSAAMLVLLAPYLAGSLGGLRGLSGSARTLAGLAMLGGGSLASGGLGMSGGYVVLMAGGAILGYASGSIQYKQSLMEKSKEELLFDCGKLYAAIKILGLKGNDMLSICGQALRMQTELESKADFEFTQANGETGKQLDIKALVMRSFRQLLRGDLK